MEYEKLGADQLLSAEVLDVVYSETDEITRTFEIVKLRKRASELKVTTALNTLLKVYDRELKRIEKENQVIDVEYRDADDNVTQFGDKYPAMRCGSWIADKNGVRVHTNKGDDIACYCPILPVQALRNVVTGKVKTRLAYFSRNKWIEFVVEKGVISSNSKIVALADYGVPVTTENARNLVKYLSDVENMNLEQIPIGKSTSKMGWQEKDSSFPEFFPYTDSLIFDGGMEFKEAYEALTPSGDRDVWFEAVKNVRAARRIEPLFFLAASLASPLLEILGVLSFCVNLWGETEGGKTVTSKLAASVWANPAKGKYMGDFCATETWIEIKQDFLNNLPLILDDSATVKDKLNFDMTSFVYNRCKEKGKGRSNKSLGIREETTWRQVIIMNGEQPVIFENMQGGAVNRTLDLTAGYSKIYADPRRLCEIIDRNYGFAGREFIDIIRSLGTDKIREIFNRQLDRVRSLDKMDKQSASLACVLTADEIAAEYLFKDGICIDLDDAAKVLCDKSFVSENERCYNYIIEQAAVYGDKFKPLGKSGDGSEDVYKNECWGCFEDEYVIIIRSVFEKLCSKGGFSAKKFLDWAKKNEKIWLDGDGKPTRLKRLGGMPKPTRCVFLLMPEYNETDSEDIPF